MRPLLFWAAENQGVFRHVLYERKRPRFILGRHSIQSHRGECQACCGICLALEHFFPRSRRGSSACSGTQPNHLENGNGKANVVAALRRPVTLKPSTPRSLMQQLFSIASDSSEDVQKQICRAFVHVADIAQEKMLPHMSRLQVVIANIDLLLPAKTLLKAGVDPPTPLEQFS